MPNRFLARKIQNELVFCTLATRRLEGILKAFLICGGIIHSSQSLYVHHHHLSQQVGVNDKKKHSLVLVFGTLFVVALWDTEQRIAGLRWMGRNCL